MAAALPAAKRLRCISAPTDSKQLIGKMSRRRLAASAYHFREKHS